MKVGAYKTLSIEANRQFEESSHRTSGMFKNFLSLCAALLSMYSMNLQALSNQLPLRPERVISFDTTEGTMMDIDLSSDGKTLLFTLLGDLYTVPVSGGEARQLTHGLAWEARPAWSPDSQWIAYISDQSGENDAWIMRSDGSSAKPLKAFATYPPEHKDFAEPEWTRDGRYVLVDGTLYGLSRGKLTLHEALRGKGLVQFSADGKSVYYARGSIDRRMMRKISAGTLMRLELSTGEERQLLTAEDGLFRYRVSPDGRWVVYATVSDAAKEEVGLRITNLATREDRWLVQRMDNWSYNSPRIVWTADSKAVIVGFGGKIHRIEITGGVDNVIAFKARINAELGPLNHHTYRVTNDPLQVRYMRSMQRSPRGDLFLFNALSRIYVQSWPQGTPKMLAPQPYGQFQPSFSPDGRWVAYITWSDTEGGAVWRVPASGGVPQRLTAVPGLYQQLAWSPDGKWLATVRVLESSRNSPKRNFGWKDLWQATGRGGEALIGELQLLPSQGGIVWVLAQKVMTQHPLSFVQDGRRLVFVQTGQASDPQSKIPMQTHLASVRLDGSDRCVIARLSMPDGIIDQITLSPNGRYVAFSAADDLYLMALPETVFELQDEAVPGMSALRLTHEGGMDARWEEGGRRLSWGYANRFSSIDVERAMKSLQIRPDETAQISLQVPRYFARGAIALRGARVISMRGDEIIENATVVIRDGRITAVDQAAAVTIPQDAKVLDLPSQTLIPGFVDLHAHAGPRSGILMQNSWEFVSRLAYGNTTTRDVSTQNRDAFGYYEQVESGSMVGPRSYSVGTELNIFSFNPEDFVTLESARNIVRRYKTFGAVILKEYELPTRLQRQNLLIAARELGVNVTGHADKTGRILFHIATILDGEAGMEHWFPETELYADVIGLLSRSGTWWTPTLTGIYQTRMLVEKYQLRNDPKARRFLTSRILMDDFSLPADPVVIQRIFKYSKNVAKVLHAGGRIGMGSHGDVSGISSHWELWAFHQGGMSAHEVLRTGTLSGAQAMGLQQDIGSIEVGKLADLIVLDRNPLENIENTLSLRYVMKNGELFDANSMDTVWPKPKTLPKWKLGE